VPIRPAVPISTDPKLNVKKDYISYNPGDELKVEKPIIKKQPTANKNLLTTLPFETPDYGATGVRGLMKANVDRYGKSFLSKEEAGTSGVSPSSVAISRDQKREQSNYKRPSSSRLNEKNWEEDNDARVEIGPAFDQGFDEAFNLEWNIDDTKPTKSDLLKEKAIQNSIKAGMSEADARKRADSGDYNWEQAFNVNPNYTMPGTYRKKTPLSTDHKTITPLDGGGEMRTQGSGRNEYVTGGATAKTESTIGKVTDKVDIGQTTHKDNKDIDDGYVTKVTKSKDKDVKEALKSDPVDTEAENTAGGENINEKKAIAAGLAAAGSPGIYTPADPGAATSAQLARQASYTPGASGKEKTVKAGKPTGKPSLEEQLALAEKQRKKLFNKG